MTARSRLYGSLVTVVVLMAGVFTTTTRRVGAAAAAEERAETPGPARVMLAGHVEQTGVFILNAKHRLTLKDFLGNHGGKPDKPPEDLVVRVYEPHPRAGGQGHGELIVQLPLDAVLDDPNVVFYLETDQAISIQDRPAARPAAKDKRGL